MPLRNFDGDTFIAFMDISGFKVLMEQGEKAVKALNILYGSGYWTLKQSKVQGLFISDSGILVSPNNLDKVDSLRSLLDVVKEINLEMLHYGFMLTTSISYGRFTYKERIEFSGIEKNPIYGNGYVSAFLDNETGKPKIQPGQCRIVTQNCPLNFDEIELQDDDILSFVQKKRDNESRYYFYWMVDEPTQIETFEQHYQDSYNLQYAGMLSALRVRY